MRIPYWTNVGYGLHLYKGDCLQVLAQMDDNTIDSIVTDPPYGLGFMGKKWDYQIPSVDIWRECLRVLKPGGHLLSFGGTRTQHRMCSNIEDAGFEIRDMIAWVYGSGFPKNLDVSKAIDKAAGAEREVVDVDERKLKQKTKAVATRAYEDFKGNNGNIIKPATPEAEQWQGWGTALKPAWEILTVAQKSLKLCSELRAKIKDLSPNLEPITVARKPLSEKTVAANVLKWGTGAINIDGCRVETDYEEQALMKAKEHKNSFVMPQDKVLGLGIKIRDYETHTEGRWPANLIHDGSQEVLGQFPETKSGAIAPHHVNRGGENRAMSGKNYARPSANFPASQGSAARFYYCAKSSKSERGEGNDHPTVKPLKLMEYLCRLVTPPGGIVLDPFMGSGTTALACINAGFGCFGVEQDSKSFQIAKNRIEARILGFRKVS